MTPIIYYANRSTLMVYVVGSLILTPFMIWLAIYPGNSTTVLGSRILFCTLAFVFSVALVTSLKAYLSNTPLLIIDGDGITDNASAYSAGFVPWSDITHVSVSNALKNHQFINLHVKNPETYINRLNAQKSTLIKKPPNLKNYTLKIPDAFLPVSADELLKTINQFRQQL